MQVEACTSCLALVSSQTKVGKHLILLVYQRLVQAPTAANAAFFLLGSDGGIYAGKTRLLSCLNRPSDLPHPVGTAWCVWSAVCNISVPIAALDVYVISLMCDIVLVIQLSLTSYSVSYALKNSISSLVCSGCTLPGPLIWLSVQWRNRSSSQGRVDRFLLALVHVSAMQQGPFSSQQSLQLFFCFTSHCGHAE